MIFYKGVFEIPLVKVCQGLPKFSEGLDDILFG